MGYLKLPDEVNSFDWNSPEFQKFTKPIVIRGGCKEMPAFKNGILIHERSIW